MHILEREHNFGSAFGPIRFVSTSLFSTLQRRTKKKKERLYAFRLLYYEIFYIISFFKLIAQEPFLMRVRRKERIINESLNYEFNYILVKTFLSCFVCQNDHVYIHI